MKLVQVTRLAAIGIAVSTTAACAANSKYTAAQRAEARADEEREEAREARAEAYKARQEAAQAQADAQRAADAQREAERRAQVANERAAEAERQASPRWQRRAGVSERQPERAVLFAAGSADLSGDARARLDEVSRAIRDRGRGVVIEGYSDDTGSESANVSISQRRADAVADYLVHSGVPRERISTRGLGSLNPVAAEDTERGRALNRRVEILIQP